MRHSLPKEMDFVNEAANANRTIRDFENIRTSLYVPEVIAATKRVLIMEYIQGGRVDDLAFLAEAGIDRNKVALGMRRRLHYIYCCPLTQVIEISRIFSQMVHINGWFHADPHPGKLLVHIYGLPFKILSPAGNLLIRSTPPSSKSPYNFEVVLLDHGQYFDIADQLRVDYSRFWLSLIASATPQVQQERRKYAELVGNIGPELVSGRRSVLEICLILLSIQCLKLLLRAGQH